MHLGTITATRTNRQHKCWNKTCAEGGDIAPGTDMVAIAWKTKDGYLRWSTHVNCFSTLLDWRIESHRKYRTSLRKVTANRPLVNLDEGVRTTRRRLLQYITRDRIAALAAQAANNTDKYISSVRRIQERLVEIEKLTPGIPVASSKMKSWVGKMPLWDEIAKGNTVSYIALNNTPVITPHTRYNHAWYTTRIQTAKEGRFEYQSRCFICGNSELPADIEERSKDFNPLLICSNECNDIMVRVMQPDSYYKSSIRGDDEDDKELEG